MVHLLTFQGSNSSCTTVLFGVQYKALTQKKQETISKLLQLVKGSAGHLDCVCDEENSGSSVSCSTIIIVAYWLSSTVYQSWWKQEDVRRFWSSLPDDAGVWREVATVPDSRFMHASSADKKSGLAILAELHQSSNEGYWGVYRNRLAASKKDDFASPFSTASTPKRPDNPVEKPIIDLSDPTGEVKSTRPGRVYLPQGFDNMVLVREYQNYSDLSKAEHEIHSRDLTPHATAWINYLDRERSKNGILSFRTTVGVDGTEIERIGSAAPPPIKTDEKNQFAYFLDLAHFERAGKAYGEHRKLRTNTMKLYGPGGELEKAGALHLMVEVSILKAEDFEAEYIGCVKGTGLMSMETILSGK